MAEGAADNHSHSILSDPAAALLSSPLRDSPTTTTTTTNTSVLPSSSGALLNRTMDSSSAGQHQHQQHQPQQHQHRTHVSSTTTTSTSSMKFSMIPPLPGSVDRKKKSMLNKENGNSRGNSGIRAARRQQQYQRDYGKFGPLPLPQGAGDPHQHNNGRSLLAEPPAARRFAAGEHGSRQQQPASPPPGGEERRLTSCSSTTATTRTNSDEASGRHHAGQTGERRMAPLGNYSANRPQQQQQQQQESTPGGAGPSLMPSSVSASAPLLSSPSCSPYSSSSSHQKQQHRGVLRYGESMESLFGVNADSSEEYRRLCRSLAYGSSKDSATWRRVLEIASSLAAADDDADGTSSAPAVDLLRLHRRATSRLSPPSADGSDGGGESQKGSGVIDDDDVVAIWLSYARAQLRRGLKQDAQLTLKHVQNWLGPQQQQPAATSGDVSELLADLERQRQAKFGSRKERHQEEAQQQKRPSSSSVPATSSNKRTKTELHHQQLVAKEEEYGSGKPGDLPASSTTSASAAAADPCHKSPVESSASAPARKPLAPVEIIQPFTSLAMTGRNCVVNADSGKKKIEPESHLKIPADIASNNTPLRPSIGNSLLASNSSAKRASTLSLSGAKATSSRPPLLLKSSAITGGSRLGRLLGPSGGKLGMPQRGVECSVLAESDDDSDVDDDDLKGSSAGKPSGGSSAQEKNHHQDSAATADDTDTVDVQLPRKITKMDLSYMMAWDPSKFRGKKQSDSNNNTDGTSSDSKLEVKDQQSDFSSPGNLETLEEEETPSVTLTSHQHSSSSKELLKSSRDEEPAHQEEKKAQGDEKTEKRGGASSDEKRPFEASADSEKPNQKKGCNDEKEERQRKIASSNEKKRATAATESSSSAEVADEASSSATRQLLKNVNTDFLPLVSEKNMLRVNGVSYARLGVIGKGGSCKVYRALSKDCKVVAIKKVKLSGMDKKAMSGYANEISLLKSLRGNPSIIQMYDSEVDLRRKVLFVVMELGEVDLNYVLQQQGQHGVVGNQAGDGNHLDMNFIRLTWQQMLSAVYSIHEARIVHGDLKPANFLFVRGSLKLIDFGIAKAIQSDDTTNIYRESQIGTVNYMSPEAIVDSGSGKNGARMKIGRASDIWSLGCILYQMVYGRTPFAKLQMIPKLHAIIDPGHEICFPTGVDELAVDAMKRCLRRNASERPPIVGPDGLLNEHKFLNSHRTSSSSSGS